MRRVNSSIDVSGLWSLLFFSFGFVSPGFFVLSSAFSFCSFSLFRLRFRFVTLNQVSNEFTVSQFQSEQQVDNLPTASKTQARNRQL